MSDLNIDTPWRRSAAEIERGLRSWAARQLGDDVVVSDVSQPEGNGMSSETVLFTLTSEGRQTRYVARLAPPAHEFPVFPTYDLETQARLMRLVGERTSVPVPGVPWYEPDEAWVGTPFVVMTRAEGVPATDMPPYVFGGWIVELSPAEREAMQRRAVEILVRLHEITPDTDDLTFLDLAHHGGVGLEQQLGYQRWYYDWAREGERYPIIERTFEWLESHRPPEGPAVLNWGDSRIGNILWVRDTPTAVLDWEMATIGPAEVDVAWMVFLHRFFQNMAERYGFPGLPEFMRRQDVAAIYEELGGRALEHLEWYEMFAALRFAIVSVRTSSRGIAHGMQERPEDPDDLVMFRSLLDDMLTDW